MNDNEKMKVFNKFKDRNEKQVIKNEGEAFNFGNTTITLKELDWDSSNDLEDEILIILENFSPFLNFEGFTNDKAINLVKKIILTLFREDLIKLANMLSQGEITLEYIRSQKATKNQIIDIVVQGIFLNYSYLKNLATLANQMK